jgi:hypothetical protein
MIYIDMNMVRAGVVNHPSEWSYGGYNELQNPRERYSLIDYESLMDLLGIRNVEELKIAYREWVEEGLVKQDLDRHPRWTESIAVGSESFIEKTRAELGIKADERRVREEDGVFEIRERGIPYHKGNSPDPIEFISDNTYLWHLPSSEKYKN